MWDIGGEDDLNPHAKLSGRYYFSPSVFFIGGWDDFLNTKANRDSLFVGRRRALGRRRHEVPGRSHTTH